MILSMYTDSTLNELRSNISVNAQKYQSCSPFVKEFISDYDAKLYSLASEVDYPLLDKTIPTRTDSKLLWEIDFENAVTLHKHFVLKYNIPLNILMDERFICYLTHDIYYDYMVARWSNSLKKEKSIKEKMFVPGGNQAFTRNTLMRFFWYTCMTYDEKAKDPYWLTKIAFDFADPVNQIMERKYSRNKKILKCALTAISNVKESNELKSKRTFFGKAINNILSIYCLDIINESELILLFENEIKKIVNSDVVDDEQVDSDEIE